MEKMAKDMDKEKREKVKKAERENQNRVFSLPNRKKAARTDSDVQGITEP